MAKILICDDEFSVLEILRAQLEHENHTCYGTTSGEEAIVLAQNNDFDLVITDVMMPKFNGLELALSLCKFTDTKVLVVTGYDHSDLTDEIKELPNFCGLVTKPWKKDTLIGLVNKNL